MDILMSIIKWMSSMNECMHVFFLIYARCYILPWTLKIKRMDACLQITPKWFFFF